jgi:hypothetical protein
MKSWLSAILGVLLGFVFWRMSFWLTGTAEPWSAATPVYLVLLFVVGALLAAMEPQRFWAAPLGLYFGQSLALTAQAVTVPSAEGSMILPLRFIFLVSYSLPAVVGAALVAALLPRRRL